MPPLTTDLRPAPWFALWNNPIAQRCRRARLRPRHLLTYGIVGVTIVTFVFLLFYRSAVFRFDATPQVAAKATLLPLLVMQGIALMGLGTATLASGIARERDRELIDYQRMTPMSPTAKILGYLFGLPSREYLLFALTLPFLAFAIFQAELPLAKVAKYYAVFFSSVWVYHLTGLCAGVVSKKPWQASVISLGSVVGLYLVLPNLSFAGLTFFDFLTVRPTFFNLIAEEIQAGGELREQGSRQAEAFIQQYQDVPFFAVHINPTLFSLAIQGFALASLFTVIHRKWVDPQRHPFSKPQGLAFQLGVIAVLVGTLWPTLAQERVLQALAYRLGGGTESNVMGWLVGLYLAVTSVVTLFVTHLITPTPHTARQGFRRAIRRGQDDVPFHLDAAPALRWVVGLFAVAVVGYALLMLAASQHQAVFDAGSSRPWGWLVAPMLIFGPACFFVHALSERYSLRFVLLALFGLWVVPVLVAVIVAVSSRQAGVEVPALWIASPSPVVAGVLAMLVLTQESGMTWHEWERPIREPLRPQVPWMLVCHVAFYLVLAVTLQLRRRGWAKAWRRQERAAA